jgi:hypothetical protein
MERGPAFLVSRDQRLVEAVVPKLREAGFDIEHLPDEDVRRVLYAQVVIADMRGGKTCHQSVRALLELLATFRVRPSAVAVIDEREGMSFAVQHGLAIVGSDVVDDEIVAATERAVRDSRRPRIL